MVVDQNVLDVVRMIEDDKALKQKSGLDQVAVEGICAKNGNPVVADGAQESDEPKRLVRWFRDNREIVATLCVVDSSHLPGQHGRQL